jgi:3'(2'), 5'-bisphosphate nucleotidase
VTQADPILDAGTGILDALTDVVSRAAAAILAARAGGIDARAKADMSPVTVCDEASEAIILEGLARLLPGLPVISEEAIGHAPTTVPGSRFALVDPLDGTRELVAGRDEFCVNVAIVSDGRPVVGIIAAPVAGLIWRTRAGGGAERLRLVAGQPVDAATVRVSIQPRLWPGGSAVATVSRHLDPDTEAFLDRVAPGVRVAIGSAVKFCHIAEGTADVYPRFGPVCLWDAAAGDAIVTAAGGIVTAPSGEPLIYSPAAERFIVPSFIAWGDPAARHAVIGTH